MSMLLSSRITNGNREQGRLDLDSYSGSRVLPRKVVERNLTLIVGGAQQGPPPSLAAFTSAKVFEVNARVPSPLPFLPFSRRSIAAPPRQRCNRPPLYRSRRKGRFTACMPPVPSTNICHVIYEPGITLCPIYYILCYVDGLAILSNRFQRLQSGHVDRAGTRSAYDVSSHLRYASIMSTSSSTLLNPISPRPLYFV